MTVRDPFAALAMIAGIGWLAAAIARERRRVRKNHRILKQLLERARPTKALPPQGLQGLQGRS